MTAAIAELIVKLRDDASKSAAEVARSLEKIVKAERDVGSQSAAMNRLTTSLKQTNEAAAKVGAFKEMQGQLSKLTEAYDKARVRARELAATLIETEKPTDRMAKAYERAVKDVKRVSDAIGSQKWAMGQAAAELDKFGVSTEKLVSGEEKLRNAIVQTTAAIKEQAVAEERAQGVTRRRAERRAALMSTAGTMGFFAGPAMLHYTGEAAAAGSGIQSQFVRMRAAGIPESEIGAAAIQSADLQSVFTNVKREAILEAYKELRSVLLHPDETPHLLPTVVNAKSAMDAIDSTGHLSEGLQFAVKGAEVLGIAQDPERFKSYMDAFVKAQQVMGKTITPEQQFEFAKYAKASGPALSDRFKFTTGVSMAQELGGSTTGQAIDQFVKQIVGGFQGNNHAAAKQFVALGLADKDDFETTKTGEIKGMKPGRKVHGSDLAQSDPDLWTYQYYLPALEKAGITEMNDQIAMTRRAFPAGRAADAVVKMITQRESFANHAKLYGEAQGLGATGLNQTDSGVALNSLRASLESFAGTLASPAMSSAASVMSSMASTISGWSKSLVDFQQAHPDIAKVLGGGALAGGAVAGGALTYGLLDGLASGFGLKGSAAALDVSAGLLNEAAVALGARNAVGAAAGTAVGAASGFFGKLGSGLSKVVPQALLMQMGAEGLDLLFKNLPGPTKTASGKPYDAQAELALSPWARMSRMWERYGPAPSAPHDPTLQEIAGKYPEHAIPRSDIRGWTPPSSGGHANVDGTFIEAAGKKAMEVGQEIKAALDITATPKVSTESIDAAIAKVRELIAAIAGIANTPIRLNSGGGQTLRGIHADAGIGGGGRGGF